MTAKVHVKIEFYRISFRNIIISIILSTSRRSEKLLI